jgi:hypothetical protein
VIVTLEARVPLDGAMRTLHYETVLAGIPPLYGICNFGHLYLKVGQLRFPADNPEGEQPILAVSHTPTEQYPEQAGAVARMLALGFEVVDDDG